MEDKTKICSLLLQTLQATREYGNLTSLEYGQQGYSETVTARWKNGQERKCYVSDDSGIAMINDILHQLP